MPGGCIEQHNTESTDEHYDEMAGNVKMVGSPLTYVGSHSSVRRDRRARLALSSSWDWISRGNRDHRMVLHSDRPLEELRAYVPSGTDGIQTDCMMHDE